MKKWLYVWLTAAVGCGLVRAEVWQDFAAYRLGDERVIPEQVERLIRETPPERHGALEENLIGILKNAGATAEAKGIACRFLQQVGTARCVEALAPLLTDPVLSHFARLPMERINAPEAVAVLREALEKAPDALKVEILGSLAERRDRASVVQAVKLAGHADPAVKRAAIRALEKIGSEEAAEALRGLQVPDAFKSSRLDALLACADGLLAEGKRAAAVSILGEPFEGTNDLYQGAALGVLLAADPDRAIERISTAIQSDSHGLNAAALTLLAHAPSPQLTRAAGAVLPKLAPEQQVALLDLLAHRGDPAALPAALASLDRENPRVREAAALAIGRLGDARQVPMLLEQARQGLKTAIDALGRLDAPGVDKALIDALKSPENRLFALKAVRLRAVREASVELIGLASDPASDVRQEAWAALGVAASGEPFVELMKLQAGIQDPREREVAEEALLAISTRVPDGKERIRIVRPYYDRGNEATRLFVLEIAGRAGTGSALDMAREALKSETKALHEKAVRILCDWPNPDAAADLLELARNASGETHRILALRGYVRMAGLVRKTGDQVIMLKTACALAKRPEEKILIAGVLQDARHVDALRMLSAFLDDEKVRKAAIPSALRLAWVLRQSAPDECGALASKLLSLAGDEGTRKKAREILDAIGEK